MPALFVGHGAAVFTTSEADLTHRFLKGLAGTVATFRPRMILVISAHYASHPLRVTGPGSLETIHDHPAQGVYNYVYPGHGSSALTRAVEEALGNVGLEVEVDPGRGLDHGAWVPLSLLHADGSAAVCQLSLDSHGGAKEHVRIGQALAPLRESGILLVGSGGVTHNQEVFRRGFFGGREVGVAESFSTEFDDWVSSVVTGMRGTERAAALADFGGHRLARMAHPTAEHFFPLLVLAGAAQEEEGKKLYEGFQHSLSTSVFQFG